MFLPVDSPDAKILGDLDNNNPVVTFKKDEIEFILGSSWGQVYVDTIDGKCYLFPAKRYVLEKRWRPYKVKGWQNTRMSHKCDSSRTTAFTSNSLNF